MKIRRMSLLAASLILASMNASAFTVYMPSGNIVQNGTFANWNFDHWSGLIAIAGNPNAPNGMIALGGDIYQDFVTTPGQQYLLDFYAAADLYFAPTLSLNVTLSSQTVLSFTTPPYTYIPQINRSDQMRWAEYSISFTAASGSTRLEFVDLNTYDFGLSAVSVVPIPEPTSMTILIMGSVVVYAVRRKQNPQA
jgi:hypothetical protein